MSSSGRVGDFVTLVRGRTYKGALVGASGPALLGLGAITPGGGFRTDYKTYGGDCPPELMLEPGDLFVSLKGATKDGEMVGSIARLPKSVRSGRLTQDTVKLVFEERHEEFERYLYWLLRTPDYRSYCAGRATGSAVVAISRDDFLNYPVPPLSPLRHEITTILERIDDKTESNRRAIRLLEELARAWFSIQFDLTQVDDGVPLGDLVTINARRVLPAGTPATYIGMSSLPEFSAEVYEWEVREAGSGQRFVAGDVLMARITPCLENGKTAVVDMLKPDEVGWGSTEYVVLSPTAAYSTAWIYCLVRDERVREFAIQSMAGTSGRQRFHGDRFAEYRITPPNEDRLAQFNALTTPLFEKMTRLRDEVRQLAALRDALLPELLSGRIRVPLEEETA